jgi:hypothetical protein
MNDTHVGRHDHLPGFFLQPPRTVRVAYWLIHDMGSQGCAAHVLGDHVARAGSRVEMSCGRTPVGQGAGAAVGRDCALAEQLSRSVGRLNYEHRDYLRRLLAEHPPHAPDGCDAAVRSSGKN